MPQKGVTAMKFRQRAIGAVFFMVLLMAGIFLYKTGGERIDAEKILSESKLKGRTFSGKVKEVAALEGSVKAYLLEEHSVPMVSVSFGFDRAGRAYEEKNGVMLLATSVMLDGAGVWDRRALRALMKEKGIKLSVAAGDDELRFSFAFIKQFQKEAMDVLRAVLYEPHFSKVDLELARKQLATVKKQNKEKPHYKLGRLVDEQFYGEHPYGRESIPEAAELKKIGKKEIMAALSAKMGRDVLSVGIAGDMDRAEAEAFLTQVFGKLNEKAEAKELPAAPGKFGGEYFVAGDESAQSFAMMLAPGVKRLDADFYPLYLADYVFGGAGLSSRLSQAIREKEGLTYGIYSYFSNSNAQDLWAVGFSATPDNVARIREILVAEYSRFYDEGVSEEELFLAKKSLMSAFNLRFAKLSQIAAMLEQMMAQKLGRDFLEKRQETVERVSLKEVNEAIKRRMPKALDGGIESGASYFEMTGK